VVERFFAWISRNRRLRLGQSLPLRRIDHAARSPYRQGSLNFETDSKSWLRKFEQSHKWIFCLRAVRIVAANQEQA
jgi:hypothetical protein